MNIVAWNCNDASGAKFLQVLRLLIQFHNHLLLILGEPRFSGTIADDVCKDIGFSGIYRVEATGFSEGIWALWRLETIQVEILEEHFRFLYIQILEPGKLPWGLVAV
uniref:Endonuclease/exonuclease/phosphatase domain-containing protein n=1 Tax=Rhizophora mucronata TaxID=61149 RepID=A0A2P2IKL4_RHIMU